jgi:hypothetical protein
MMGWPFSDADAAVWVVTLVAARPSNVYNTLAELHPVQVSIGSAKPKKRKRHAATIAVIKSGNSNRESYLPS